MRILFVGAGATGGYFGGRLAEAGKDVTFLVRPRRAAALTERGLRIKSPTRETTVKPRLVTADTLGEPYDIVVLAVKSYMLEDALRDVAPAVGEETVVVPLLNGMRHLDTLTAAFGPERAYGGVCMIHATLDEDGDVVQFTGMHRLVLGRPDGEYDDRVIDALTGADFSVVPSTDIIHDMWEKWIFLASIGAATTLLRASIGEINSVSRGTALTSAIAAESTAVAVAAGHPPRDGARAFLRAGMVTTERTTSSMYRDMAAGSPVEADSVLGDFVAEAERLGVPVPLLSAAYTNLAIYAARRTSDRAVR